MREKPSRVRGERETRSEDSTSDRRVREGFSVEVACMMGRRESSQV